MSNDQEYTIQPEKQSQVGKIIDTILPELRGPGDVPESSVAINTYDFAIDLLEETVKTIQARLPPMRRLRNAKLPINQLPPELLQYIFMPEFNVWGACCSPSLVYLMALRSVCHRWMVAIDNCALLWARIHTLDPCTLQERAIKMSGTSLLDVSVDSLSPWITRSLADRIASSSYRWRSISIDASHAAGSSFPKEIARFLKRPAPCLELCSIQWPRRRFPSEANVLSQMNNLRFLQLSNAVPLRDIPETLNVLPKLLSLSLGGPTSADSVAELWGILTACPLLQALRLDLELHVVDRNSIPTISLPNLEVAELSVNRSLAQALLRRAIPITTSVHVMLDQSERLGGVAACLRSRIQAGCEAARVGESRRHGSSCANITMGSVTLSLADMPVVTWLLEELPLTLRSTVKTLHLSHLVRLHDLQALDRLLPNITILSFDEGCSSDATQGLLYPQNGLTYALFPNASKLVVRRRRQDKSRQGLQGHHLVALVRNWVEADVGLTELDAEVSETILPDEVQQLKDLVANCQVTIIPALNKDFRAFW